MTKVEIDGRTYCVETLIYTVERLTKDVKASAEYHRLVLEQIRAEIEQNIGDNPYKNDGIYCSLHVLDNYMMPCVTKKELQHCREVVKKYAPRVKAERR